MREYLAAQQSRGTMDRRKLDTLQAGRGFAALAVLLFHTETTLQMAKYLGHETFAVFRGGYIGIDFFFVLSGFVIMLAHEQDLGQPDRVLSFLWRRFKRIYPLLWVTLVLTSLMIVFVLKAVPSAWDIVAGFVILPSTTDPLLTVEWTLRREIIFYALFAIMILWRFTGMILLGGWFALSLVLPYLGVTGLSAVFFDTHHLLFGLGMGICWLYLRGHIRYPAVLTGAGTIAFFIMWSVLAFNYELSSDPTCRLLAGTGAAVAIAGLVGLESETALRVPRPLIFLGEASYAIYLIHLPVISALGRIVVRFRDQAPAPVLVLAVAVAALAIGAAYHIWVERPLMRFVNSLGKPRHGNV